MVFQEFYAFFRLLNISYLIQNQFEIISSKKRESQEISNFISALSFRDSNKIFSGFKSL